MSSKSQANHHFKMALTYAKRGRWFMAELEANRADRYGGITPKQRARIQEAKQRSRYVTNPMLNSIEQAQVEIRLWMRRAGERYRQVVQSPKSHGAAHYDHALRNARKDIARATGVPERLLS